MENALGELVASHGGELDYSLGIYIPEFLPLARFLYSELVLRCLPSARDERSFRRTLTELSSSVVDEIVSPVATDPLTHHVPHDEWRRLAPRGVKTLHLSARETVRRQLHNLIVQQELPYWIHRFKTQAGPAGQLQPKQEEGGTPPSYSPELGVPRRTPDLKSSRERIELVTTLARELATLKPDLSRFSSAEGLKKKYPDFILWGHLQDAELKELVDGSAFKPKAYAETLTLRKFGLTSRDTLKKDRSKLRKAENNGLA